MLKLLKETWGEISFLLTLCGGFWGLLQPPVGAYPEAYTGFVGALVLSAALGVRFSLNAWATKARIVPIMFGLAVIFLIPAVIGFYVYLPARSNLVFDYEVDVDSSAEVIKGAEYHPHIEKIRQQNVLTDEDLLAEAGGIGARDLVWTPESIAEAEQKLTFWYLLTALSTLLSTMFAIELLRMRMQKKE